jgi:DNA-binding XRE family transcriptional regulator
MTKDFEPPRLEGSRVNNIARNLVLHRKWLFALRSRDTIAALRTKDGGFWKCVSAISAVHEFNSRRLPHYRVAYHRVWTQSEHVVNDRRVKTDALHQFGLRIRQLRLERKLSQEDLAELANLHRNYVSQIETGRRNVSLLNILKLAHGLNVKPTKLIETIR